MVDKKIAALLPKRPPDAHKGSCGRVGIIAGSNNMMGAAILTAKATLRSGSGLVYLLTIPESAESINAAMPELILLPLKSESGWLTKSSLLLIQEYIEEFSFDAVAIGPGLGRSKSTQSFVKSTLQYLNEQKIKTVIDADALFALNQNELENLNNEQFILTPHPKEFERLFKTTPGKDDKFRLRSAENAAKIAQEIIVLKGRHTVVTTKTESYTNKTGNPGMATAGTGDVLTGIITSLIGQGLTTFDAAKLGVYVHGLAGDIACKKQGIMSMTASDIIDFLGKAFLELEKC